MNKFLTLLWGTTKLLLANFFCLFAKKQFWLVCEKTNEARDNGYYFFKHCMHSSYASKVFYVIDENSYDIGKLKEYQNNIIYTNSFRHCIMYFRAIKLISSQALPFPYSEKLCKRFFRQKKQKYIWLQHGITKDKLNPKDMSKQYKEYSLVCCASPFEADFFRTEFGYDYNSAQNTGFCRFDGLEDLSKNNKQVLIMPTFRKWLTSKNKTSAPTQEEISLFCKSSYYSFYHDLLKKIKNNLFFKDNDIKFIFYQHYAFQPYQDLFEEFQCKNIIIAKSHNFDVQMLLKESNLLITDYSSVFFDFAYMKKPIVYFQFDADEYRASHYKEGYFSYKKHGFGPCCMTVTDVIDQLDQTIRENFTMQEKFLSRTKSFFGKIDNQNTDRVFREVEKL